MVRNLGQNIYNITWKDRVYLIMIEGQWAMIQEVFQKGKIWVQSLRSMVTKFMSPVVGFSSTGEQESL